MKLEINNLVCGYGREPVVKDLSLSLDSGEIVCLLGPNGVGKTTLFKAILGLLPRTSGSITLDGRDIRHFKEQRLAREIAYVPQAHTPPFPFSVMDVVLLGRTAHLGPFASPSPLDYALAEEALSSLHIFFLKDRIYTEISGGERQMVLVARALAQQSRILVLDEPTSHLDFGNQVRVLQQINRLVKKGLSVIMTTHFPNHAFLCATQVVLMQHHNRFQSGTPNKIITEANLLSAYGVEVKIVDTKTHEGDIIKSCVPLIAHSNVEAP
ncbi:MAG: iron ABC transporter ATP-binding protein [Elusimicrobia bacterium RIFOXYB2_FULL_49_7]|nr:MAG: iron ABC transporter ATP-binding protein [Elusimicrobia bacterium RIFOXYB2_FULL_49_7]